MEMRAKAGGVQHSQGENRMEQNSNEKGRDYEMETRLRKLLGRMSYNEKVMLLRLIEAARSGRGRSLCPLDSTGKTSQ